MRAGGFYFAAYSVLFSGNGEELRLVSSQLGADDMKKLLSLTLLASITLTPTAWAQGTDAQRQACEDDANKWCPYAIPDPDKVEACLQKVVSQISADCQAQFGYKPGKAKKR